jgi:hypothetical protein
MTNLIIVTADEGRPRAVEMLSCMAVRDTNDDDDDDDNDGDNDGNALL